MMSDLHNARGYCRVDLHKLGGGGGGGGEQS